MRKMVLLFAVALIASGCDDSCSPGSLRCKCGQDQTCNDGLVCMADSCVKQVCLETETKGSTICDVCGGNLVCQNNAWTIKNIQCPENVTCTCSGTDCTRGTADAGSGSGGSLGSGGSGSGGSVPDASPDVPSGSGGSGSGGANGSGGSGSGGSTVDASADAISRCNNDYCWCSESTAETARCCSSKYAISSIGSGGPFVRLKNDTRVAYANTFGTLGYYYMSEDTLRTWHTACNDTAHMDPSTPPDPFLSCTDVTMFEDNYKTIFSLKAVNSDFVVPPRPGMRILCRLVDGGESCYVQTHDMKIHLVTNWDLAVSLFGQNAAAFKVFLPSATMDKMTEGEEVTAETLSDGGIGSDAVDGGAVPLSTYDRVAECNKSTPQQSGDLQTFLNKLL